MAYVNGISTNHNGPCWERLRILIGIKFQRVGLVIVLKFKTRLGNTEQPVFFALHNFLSRVWIVAYYEVLQIKHVHLHRTVTPTKEEQKTCSLTTQGCGSMAGDTKTLLSSAFISFFGDVKMCMMWGGTRGVEIEQAYILLRESPFFYMRLRKKEAICAENVLLSLSSET